MPRRRHICDVAGCTRERERWQRLCTSCFGRLTGHRDIRTGILDAHRTGNMKAKRALCRRAGALLGLDRPNEAAPANPPPTRTASPPPNAWWLND